MSGEGSPSHTPTGPTPTGPTPSAPRFPLSAIVGQRPLIEALLVNAVSPEVGGVLVRGERGTAKSTAVRALAPLLAPVHAAVGETYAFGPGHAAPGGVVAAGVETEQRAAPLVELPLGATLDRLVGALDLRQALAGDHSFEPGILARAHQGILYVDEVNLLADHLVDALLDAAASGVARVEREAVSVEHDARFILVGTMNVEEGELRPQLLDRFGLGVEVRAPREAGERAEIVRRRLAFERDPAAFVERFAQDERELAARIAAARERLDAVRLPERELLRIAGACAQLGVDGVRGDLVTARAARALAALDGADEVDETHVRRAAALALAHRRRRDPLDGRQPDPEDVERALDAAPGGASRPGEGDEGPEDDPPEDDPPGGAPPPGSSSEPSTESQQPDAPAPPQRHDPPAPARLPAAALELIGNGTGPLGRRARTSGPQAGAIDSRPASTDEQRRTDGEDVAIVATLHARLLGAPADHIRGPIRSGREGALLCLVVDASGSMGARRRLARVKGALLELLRDAYARRDRVGLIAFRDRSAEIVIAPGAPLERAAEAIRALPAGGRTPLAAGLDAAERLIANEALREPGRRAIAVVLTDGRAQDPEHQIPHAAARLGRVASAVHVIDIEDGPVRLGLAAAVASAAGAQLHRLLGETRPKRSAA
ncbi:MAG TPA: VWA domain-containing protein [Solirubrobacteraceae bacterium]|jgi:magnesium chelatase subunit D|nr:VWA domain-containing protein [Solirubrobacteraceae bacterium]